MHNNQAAQDIARETIHDLHGFIQVGMSEKTIAEKCRQLMEAKGSNGWWYHGLPALVLLGSRSTLSISGRDYQPLEDNRVSATDIITIDLSPTLDGWWGDYARAIFIEDGVVAEEDRPRTPLFRQGLEAELHLHARLLEIAVPEMPLDTLYQVMNQEITALGFENLDYRGNLGHTIEAHESERVYIERGSTATFAQLGRPFTFEPQIRALGGNIGFKREDIYYFDADGRLRRL